MKTSRSLTKKVFRITIASFFVSNFMMLLGSVIDGFVVGNNMDANRIAAIGLASPAVILFAVIGAAAGSSFQGRSLRCLNRGDVAGVLRACSIGILFQTIVLMFANYIQLFGHNMIAIIVIINSNFFVPLIGAAFGAELAKMISGSIIVGIFRGITACHIVSALLLLPLVLLLRFRDDCRGFDPRKKYETFFGSEDVSKLIGIRMIMAEAKEVRYTTLLHLNNLIICISPKDSKEEPAESSQ